MKIIEPLMVKYSTTNFHNQMPNKNLSLSQPNNPVQKRKRKPVRDWSLEHETAHGAGSAIPVARLAPFHGNLTSLRSGFSRVANARSDCSCCLFDAIDWTFFRIQPSRSSASMDGHDGR